MRIHDVYCAILKDYNPRQTDKVYMIVVNTNLCTFSFVDVMRRIESLCAVGLRAASVFAQQECTVIQWCAGGGTGVLFDLSTRKRSIPSVQSN